MYENLKINSRYKHIAGKHIVIKNSKCMAYRGKMPGEEFPENEHMNIET